MTQLQILYLTTAIPTVFEQSLPSEIAWKNPSICHRFYRVGQPEAARRVANLGNKGTELAKYLIEIKFWEGVYYNPDVNHPLDGNGEHIASYYNQVKKSCNYSVDKVPVGHKVINYRPSPTKVTSYLKLTAKHSVDYDQIKKVPFGLGMSRGGTHVWLFSYGKVYESHWNKEAVDGLYTETELDRFIWLSGIIVVPPDAHHLLSISKVTFG